MRDPDLVQRARRAADALERAWGHWRTMHGLGADPLPPVSSYVGYSLEEPWGQPRVVFGIGAEEAERLAGLLDGHDCIGPVHAELVGRPDWRRSGDAALPPSESAGQGRGVRVPLQSSRPASDSGLAQSHVPPRPERATKALAPSPDRTNSPAKPDITRNRVRQEPAEASSAAQVFAAAPVADLASGSAEAPAQVRGTDRSGDRQQDGLAIGPEQTAVGAAKQPDRMPTTHAEPGEAGNQPESQVPHAATKSKRARERSHVAGAADGSHVVGAGDGGDPAGAGDGAQKPSGVVGTRDGSAAAPGSESARAGANSAV